MIAVFKPDTSVSRLASSKETVTQDLASFFMKLFGKEKTYTAKRRSVNFIELSNTRNMFHTDKIVIRSCYQRLTPHIRESMNVPGILRRVAVTGTPGIGKTVYGTLLTRFYVLQKKLTVVYWERGNVYAFSWDEGMKVRFGLTPLATHKNAVLYFGWWTDGADPSFNDLLRLENAIVIHDPRQGFEDVAHNVDGIHRIVFVLSYSHSLISLWKSKDLRPSRYFYMPLWTEQEGIDAFGLWEKELSHNEYERFGGCIRGWIFPEMLASLEQKAKDCVQKHGADVLGRTTDMKGSLVHMHVDFDDSTLASTAASNADTTSPNDFASYHFCFGSSTITSFINRAILDAGGDALERCIQTWSTQSGFESIHGGLFELHCHYLLCQRKTPLTLRCRRVYRNDGDNTDKINSIELPVIQGTTRYKSNDPSILGGDDYANDIKVGQYLWPYSNVHPTYDSAVLVEGCDVGSLDDELVPLYLQMTVSGASGLPRQPKHSMKQYVRKAFNKALRKHNKSISPGITTFVVPSECFEPFLFQHESLKDDDEMQTVNQPEYQLVVEIPDFFHLLTKQDTLDTLLPVSSASKRVHRYSSTLRGAHKKTKTEQE